MAVQRTIYRNEAQKWSTSQCRSILENWDIFGNVGNDSTVIMLNNIFQPSSATLMFFFEVQLHASTACRHRQRSKYLI